VLPRVIERLGLAMSFPLAITPVAAAVLITRAAAPWSVGHPQPPLWLNRSYPVRAAWSAHMKLGEISGVIASYYNGSFPNTKTRLAKYGKI
jgi:hypothetical protein